MKKKKDHQRIKCPYCGRTAVLRKASYVYKERALDEYLYVCSGYPDCDAYVGVHAGTVIPKGSLANGDLRHKRHGGKLADVAAGFSTPSGGMGSSADVTPTGGCRIPFPFLMHRPTLDSSRITVANASYRNAKRY